MTTITVPGPITAIVCGSAATISSLTGGPSGSPATIAPTTTSNSIFLITAPSGSQFFQIDPAFNVGDVVELYYDPNVSSVPAAMIVADENGNNVSPQFTQTAGRGYSLKKVSTGASFNWVRTF